MKDINKILTDFLTNLNSVLRSNIELEQAKKYLFGNKFSRAFIIIRGLRNFHDSVIYRARAIGEKEDIKDMLTFSYPPIDCNKLGRANLKSKQVLYASNCPTTAILEYLNTGVSNENIFLSVWEYANKRSIQTFWIGDFPYDIEYLKEFVSPYSNEETLRLFVEIFDKLKLIYRGDNYNFSAPLSYFLMYKHEICEMVKYPSIVTGFESNNYAISKDFFNDQFTLKKVYRMNEVEKTDTSQYGEIYKNSILINEPKEVGKLVNSKIVYDKLDETDLEFWGKYN